MHILFVCTGNICRSPVAERLAVAFCSQLSVNGIVASSAGTHAVAGHPVHDKAAIALRSLGGDPSDFRARQITLRAATDANLILTMTKQHRDSVLQLAPRLLRRTFLLSEASLLASKFEVDNLSGLSDFRPFISARELVEVDDPFGREQDAFDTACAEIASMLPPVLRLCGRQLSLEADRVGDGEE